jgi:protein dithiol oxidoreductase (disulfide-forming)
MHLIRSWLCAFFFIVLACSAQAAPIVGDDYVLLSVPQATEAGKKVEVIEFFAYYCPHCNALDEPLKNWVTMMGDNVVFKRVHTSVTGEAVPQQRLFYALESMGRENEFHSKILNAIHRQHRRLDTDDDIVDFMVQQGIDKQKFLDTYQSFTVQTKVKRALQMQESYEIHSWPTIVVDGRFVTSPPIVGAKLETYNEEVAQQMMLKSLNQLVAQQHVARN